MSGSRDKPRIIYFNEGISVVNYKNRPSEYLKYDESKDLIERYPDDIVIEIAYMDEPECKL